MTATEPPLNFNSRRDIQSARAMRDEVISSEHDVDVQSDAIRVETVSRRRIVHVVVHEAREHSVRKRGPRGAASVGIGCGARGLTRAAADCVLALATIGARRYV